MPKTKPLDHMAVRHLGIISQRCLYWWRFLPVSVRSWYDLDDMIAEVVLHVVRVAERYNPDRARDSTFVWHVADNRCRKILSRYQRIKRGAQLETQMPEHTERWYPAPVENSVVESLQAVEEVIAHLPPKALDLVASHFNGHVGWRPDRRVIHQIRAVAAGRASLEDFERVRKCMA